MNQIASRPHVAVPSTASDLKVIDDKYEKYLRVLDEYQAARTELSACLSSVNPDRSLCNKFLADLRQPKGYFSLAQANFTSPNRIRHGQDFYDERMQATMRVEFTGKFQVTVREAQEQEMKKDPLNWYGLFVPPALKAAQKQFKVAMTEIVPRIVNLEAQLRAIQDDITTSKA
ncbi:MAG: hypothetical protein M1814_005216 [Vezdaea aestivalis]|nr:MAG: hypothetical protein M1814_005216 [Vezdaea aestivalis]